MERLCACPDNIGHVFVPFEITAKPLGKLEFSVFFKRNLHNNRRATGLTVQTRDLDVGLM